MSPEEVAEAEAVHRGTELLLMRTGELLEQTDRTLKAFTEELALELMAMSSDEQLAFFNEVKAAVRNIKSHPIAEILPAGLLNDSVLIEEIWSTFLDDLAKAGYLAPPSAGFQ